jgi:hypothetical protein
VSPNVGFHWTLKHVEVSIDDLPVALKHDRGFFERLLAV